MSIFLIDYENSTNLKGIGNLSSDDKVIIFYSEKANTLTFDLQQEILSSKATIEYKKVEVGVPNALDFQLCSYLGYLIKENENNEMNYYIIITKDKGYSSKMVSFWKGEKSIAIKIQDSIESSVKAVQTKNSLDNEISETLRKSEISLTDNEISEIEKIVLKYKTTSTVNGNINKVLKDSTKAGCVMKVVKPFINKAINKVG